MIRLKHTSERNSQIRVRSTSYSIDASGYIEAEDDHAKILMYSSLIERAADQTVTVGSETEKKEPVKAPRSEQSNTSLKVKLPLTMPEKVEALGGTLKVGLPLTIPEKVELPGGMLDVKANDEGDLSAKSRQEIIGLAESLGVPIDKRNSTLNLIATIRDFKSKSENESHETVATKEL